LNDIEEIPVETVGGTRPSTAVGDRLMIGLAALALLGGLLIAAGNVLGGLFDDAVAVESPTTSSAATPDREATPRPTRTERPLREITLVPGEPPEQPDSNFTPTYWVEVTRQIVVRSAASDQAAMQGVLDDGDVVLASQRSSEDAEWLAIDGPEGGWIRIAGKNGEPRARIAPAAQGHLSGNVFGIAAGPNGFVAHGWGPGTAFAQPTGVALYSPNGEEWTEAEMPVQPGYGGWAAAWGPSGWLAAATLDEVDAPAPWIWESSDGAYWTAVGQMAEAGQGYVAGLVANEAGYLLALGSRGSGEAVLWYSPDGITWQESDETGLARADRGLFGGGGTELLATPHGFLAWTRSEGLSDTAEIAFSRTGRSWETTALSDDPVGLFGVAVVHDAVVATGLAEDGRMRAWNGRIVDGSLALSAAPQQESAFEGAVVTRLVADRDRAYALGYERDGGASRAWTSAGGIWHALALPENGFGGVPRVAAGGAQGVVVAGLRVGMLASSPVFWHLGPDASWRSEATPILPAIADPDPADCPPPPATAFDFMVLEAGVAVACFGDASMTFSAWSGACDGCWGGEPPRRPGPDWLWSPWPHLLLLPSEGTVDTGWWRLGALHPDLRWREAWSDTWLRVTGHFDDPAAQRCGGGPELGSEGWWHGPEIDVLQCRLTFVVTGVEVLGREAA